MYWTEVVSKKDLGQGVTNELIKSIIVYLCYDFTYLWFHFLNVNTAAVLAQSI